MGGKIKISAVLEVVTGMHIGGSSEYSPIGAVDSPVISDPRTGQPVIPGSSLKGKMRTLLVRSIDGDTKKPHNEDPAEVLRLFGASAPIIKSRLQFADAFVMNADAFKNVGLTEVKFENSINRGTGVANPRQIERVVRGVKFAICIVYDAPDNEAEAAEDMKNLAKAMKLLQMDYLGGHGTRGSGRVSFSDISLSSPDKSVARELLEDVSQHFFAVEKYELLSL